MAENEAETPGRQENLTIELDLPGRIGFVETQAARLLRLEVVETLKVGTDEQIGAAMSRYHEAVADDIDELGPEARTRAQIGLLVAIGQMHLAAGRIKDGLEELGDAIFYAQSMGLDPIADDIDALRLDARLSHD